MKKFKTLRTLLLAACACLLPTKMLAQRVTVSPTSGKVITAKSFKYTTSTSTSKTTLTEAQTVGFGSMWVHNQLPLTMISSSAALDTLLSDGLLKTHGNDMSITLAPDSGITLLSGGVSTTGGSIDTKKMGKNYLVLSLPQGYRFTAYKIVLKNNISKSAIPTIDSSFTESEFNDGVEMFFEETLPGLNGTAYIADATVSQSVSVGKMNSGTEAILMRTSEEQSDMGNKLYFRYGQDTSWGFTVMSIQSFEVSFEAASPFTVEVKPTASTLRGFDCVTSEFNSGRIDVGPIQQQTKDGKKFYGYNYNRVEEIQASCFLFNKNGINSTTNVPDPTVFADSSRAIRGEALSGSSTSSPNYAYILKEGEYWLETPTVMYSQSSDNNDKGTEIPVGYRITGAKVNYKVKDIYAPADSFLIYYTTDPGTYSKFAHYLHLIKRSFDNKQDTLYFDWQSVLRDYVEKYEYNYETYLTQRKNLPMAFWYLYKPENSNTGSSSDDAFIYTTTIDSVSAYGTSQWTYHKKRHYLSVKYDNINHVYYLAVVQSDATTAEGLENDGIVPMRKRADGTISLGSGYTAHYLQKKSDISGTADSGIFLFKEDKTSAAIVKDIYFDSDNKVVGKSGNYKLTVYDKDDSTSETLMVDDPSSDGTITLTDLNNDAIHFKVEKADGATSTDSVEAALTFELTLEPLNPYVQKMDIKGVSSDSSSVSHSLSQQFVTTDFRIGSDDMPFYVPKALTTSEQKIKFSFTNLYNIYHDDMYFTGGGNGNSRYNFVQSKYYESVHEDLHNNKETVWTDGDYTEKTEVLTYGTVPFIFNNADSLVAERTDDDTRYFKEFRFSESNYTNGIGTTQGKFDTLYIKVNDTAEHKFNLFVADETRYNISPAMGMRHQYYAFYHGSLILEVADYEPVITYQKLYEKALTTGNTAMNSTIYYGATVKAKKTETSATLSDTVSVYLTAKQILEQLKKDTIDSDGSVTPASTSNILYIDASNLTSVLHDVDGEAKPKTTTEIGSLTALRTALGKNALIYLPHITTCYVDNTARKMISGLFTSCQDIVITDKEPFHAPYGISLDSEKTVTYERLQSGNNEKPKYATLILPFSVEVSNGVYTNKYGDDQLKFYLPNTDSFLSNIESSKAEEGTDYRGTANFVDYTTLTETKANESYLVEVVSRSEGVHGFKVVQNGTDIKATGIDSTKNVSYGVVMSNDPFNVTINNETVPFTLQGSYAGDTFTKGTDNIFYFGNSEFYSLSNLAGSTLKVRPFRAYFKWSSTSSNNVTAKIARLAIGFDDSGTTDVVIPVFNNADNSGISVWTADGNIMVVAHKDADVAVRNVAGQIIGRSAMSAGDRYSITVPRGLYIVNGTKVIVK